MHSYHIYISSLFLPYTLATQCHQHQLVCICIIMLSIIEITSHSCHRYKMYFLAFILPPSRGSELSEKDKLIDHSTTHSHFCVGASFNVSKIATGVVSVDIMPQRHTWPLLMLLCFFSWPVTVLPYSLCLVLLLSNSCFLPLIWNPP